MTCSVCLFFYINLKRSGQKYNCQLVALGAYWLFCLCGKNASQCWKWKEWFNHLLTTDKTKKPRKCIILFTHWRNTWTTLKSWSCNYFWNMLQYCEIYSPLSQWPILFFFCCWLFVLCRTNQTTQNGYQQPKSIKPQTRGALMLNSAVMAPPSRIIILWFSHSVI